MISPRAHEADNTVIIVERAVPEDAEAIMTLKRAAWLEAYPSNEHGVSRDDIDKKFPAEALAEGITNWQRGIASEIDDGNRVTFVARVNGGVAGYTSPTQEDGQKRIGAMYVSPDMQGMGIGSQLLQQAITWHGREDDIYLHVLRYNQNAIDFYQRHGFTATGKAFPAEYDPEQGIKLLPEIEMVLPKLEQPQ